MKQYRTQKNGFTLVESLVGISLILIGIAFVFTAAQLGLHSANAVRDRITAAFLAQEAIENVRNIKDSNLHKIDNGSSRYWLYGIINHAGDGSTTCAEDTNGNQGSAGCGFDANQAFNIDYLDNGAILASHRSLFGCDAPHNGCKVLVNTSTSTPLGYVQTLGIPAGYSDSSFTRKIFVHETTLQGGGKEAIVTVVVSKSGIMPFELTDVIYNWY